MRKFIDILFIVLLAGVGLLQSCAHESLEEVWKNDKYLSLQLIVSENKEPKTRAVEADLIAQENKINKIEILFFNGENFVWQALNVTLDAENKVAIPLPEGHPLVEGVEYGVYVIANVDITNFDYSTLTELKNNIISYSFENNGKDLPPLFVMEGSTLSTISLSNLNLGTIALKRVLSKIRIRIKTGGTITAQMNGAFPEVALKNYKTEATLIDTYIIPANLALKSDGYITADSLITDMGLTTDFPFYTCPNNWGNDPAKETYLMVKIPQTENGVTTDHFYKVGFNYYLQEGNSEMLNIHGLNRNYYYDVEVFINQPGSSDEGEPQEVSGSYTIKNWTTNEVYGSITSELYLSISEESIIMNNVATYSISYSSSAPVTIKDITPTGVNVTVVPSGSDVTKGVITIGSTVPADYKAKNISFVVTNATNNKVGLDVKVAIKQLPPITISVEIATKAYMNIEPPASLSKNIYIIKSTATTAGANKIVAFPELIAGKTANTETTSKKVSPKLMLASQIGDVAGKSYAEAQTYCSEYWETNNLLVTYEDWRLPTQEELKMIDMLQDNGAIAPKMNQPYYWQAYSSIGPFNMANNTNATAQTTAAVRCVRDIK